MKNKETKNIVDLKIDNELNEVFEFMDRENVVYLGEPLEHKGKHYYVTIEEKEHTVLKRDED